MNGVGVPTTLTFVFVPSAQGVLNMFGSTEFGGCVCVLMDRNVARVTFCWMHYVLDGVGDLACLQLAPLPQPISDLLWDIGYGEFIWEHRLAKSLKVPTFGSVWSWSVWLQFV